VKRHLLESVRKDHGLSEEVRQEALTLAERLREEEDPQLLNNASWAVVAKPGADATAYHLALLQAEEACRLAPGDSYFLNTLGVAQYRLGQYERAVDTLSRSTKLSATQEVGSLPADMAFLAMAHWRLA